MATTTKHYVVSDDGYHDPQVGYHEFDEFSGTDFVPVATFHGPDAKAEAKFFADWMNVKNYGARVRAAVATHRKG